MSNQYRRLYRSRRDRVIAGVCGGLGGYLGVDPVIVRLVWLVTVLLGGTGVLAYVIAWILIPEASEDNDPGVVERNSEGTKIIGIIFIVIALLWLASRFGHQYFYFMPWGWIIPIGFVALGLVLILRPKAQQAADYGEENNVVDAKVVSEEKTETGEENKDKGDEKDRPFDSSLRRSRNDRVLFGLCGGMAKHFNVDSTIVRLLWAITAIASFGIVFIAYLVMALVVPEEIE